MEDEHKVFIQSLDETAWDTVETEWKEPRRGQRVRHNKIFKKVVKQRFGWSDAKRNSACANAKALNTIFTSVDEEQFKFIVTSTSAKKAWYALKVVHEGTSTVRISQSKMLTT